MLKLENFNTPKICTLNNRELYLVFRNKEDIQRKSDIIYIYEQHSQKAIPFHIFMFNRRFPEAQILGNLQETKVDYHINQPERYFCLSSGLLNKETKMYFPHDQNISDEIDEVVDNYWQHFHERKQQKKKSFPQNVFIQKYQQLYNSTIQFTDRFIFCLRKELKYI